MPSRTLIRVLFICTGNICRSPLAEGVFLHKINRRGLAHLFAVDSCGTGNWHAGERPDPRVLELAAERGVSLPGVARQVTDDDLRRFDHIICMDEEHRDHVLYMGAPANKVKMLLEFHPQPPMAEVPDPYFGERDGFELVYDLVDAATDGLIDALANQVP
jgi:protein-tyrosine phosphatase